MSARKAAPAVPPPLAQSPRERLGRALHGVAFALLLAVLAARPMLGEMPFRTSMMPKNLPEVLAGRAEPLPTSRTELARVSCAMLILLAVAIWAVGCGALGEAGLRHAWFGVAAVVLCLGMTASAATAADGRSAQLSALEQASLLAACFLAVQLCAEPRRLRLLLAVLAAVALTLAAKAAWQVLVEAPDRVADFEIYRDERLGAFGWPAGTPQAEMLEFRIRDPAPFGFFALANYFASLLILLLGATAALAADRIATARATRLRRSKKDAPPGQIDTRLLAGGLAGLAALGTVVIIVLTASRGGILACVAAVVFGAGAALLHRRLAGRWRTAVGTAALLVLLGIGGAVGYGLANDRLPEKSMTHRWFYWTASAKIVAEKPLQGVGGGNFGDAYLRHRRPEAEEAVKTPHNFIVHALAQYGLPGGLLYVGLVVWVLVASCRPHRPRPREPRPAPPSSRLRSLAALALCLASVAFARMYFAGAASSPVLLFFDAVLPVAVFTIGLMAGAWAAGLLGAEPRGMPGPLVRIAVVAALAGFVLHNLITYSLWAPGAAMPFWMLAGAALALSPSRPRALGGLRWGLAAVAGGGLLAAGVLLLGPVLRRTVLQERAIAPGRAGFDQRQRLLRLAASADRLDDIAADDLARFLLTAPPDAVRLSQAMRWAQEAIRRNPADYGHQELAARIAMRQRDPATAVEHMAWAVRLNPREARLRVDYAEMLLAAGRQEGCLQQLEAAEEINARLKAFDPGSLQLLRPMERARIEALRRGASGER